MNDFARDTGWLHAPMLAYATYGVVLFAGLLLAGWWLARDRGPRTMAAALWTGAATLIAVAANQPIVNGVHEARPYTDHPHILVLAHRSADFSFPSDHAVMAGAVAAGLWLVSRRLGDRRDGRGAADGGSLGSTSRRTTLTTCSPGSRSALASCWSVGCCCPDR